MCSAHSTEVKRDRWEGFLEEGALEAGVPWVQGWFLLQWDCYGLTKAEQRGAESFFQELEAGSRSSQPGAWQASGHRKVVRTSERGQPHPRGKGLPSVPTPDPQVAPTTCASKSLEAQPLRATLCQSNPTSALYRQPLRQAGLRE